MDKIPGGASGIGRAVCQALAAEGASIVVTDLNNQGAQETIDSLSKHADNRHVSYSLDVSSGEEVRKVLEYIISGYKKPPCILVNSAGITSDDFMLNMDEEKFDKVIQVNLKVLPHAIISKMKFASELTGFWGMHCYISCKMFGSVSVNMHFT